jgi:hypothetical protein
LLDFVELPKRGGVLPSDAHVRRVGPGMLAEAPSEEFVVSRKP